MAYVFPKAQIRKLNLYTHSSDTELILNPENSGSVILLDNSTNNLEIRLPGVQYNAGLNFTFLVINTANSKTIKIHSKTNKGVFETKIKRAGTDGTEVNTLIITSHGSSSEMGDKVEAICNGINWFLNVVGGESETSSTYSTE